MLTDENEPEFNQEEEAKIERIINALKQAYKALKRPFPETPHEQVETVYDIIDKLSKPIAEDYDQNGFQKSDRLNIYTDGENRTIVTVDINTGITPYVINDKETDRLLKSLCYLVPQDIKPTHEWYRPTLEEHKLLPMNMREHVSKGGLVLRKIGETFQTTFKQQIRKLTNKNLNKNLN